MIDYFIPAFLCGCGFSYIVAFVISQVLAARNIYKVSVYTSSGILVGSVNVKAIDTNSAIKKGYKFITKYSGINFMICLPIVEEVKKND